MAFCLTEKVWIWPFSRKNFHLTSFWEKNNAVSTLVSRNRRRCHMKHARRRMVYSSKTITKMAAILLFALSVTRVHADFYYGDSNYSDMAAMGLAQTTNFSTNADDGTATLIIHDGRQKDAIEECAHRLGLTNNQEMDLEYNAIQITFHDRELMPMVFWTSHRCQL